MSNIKKGSKLTVSTANGISRATSSNLGVLEISGPKMTDIAYTYGTTPAHLVIGATDVSGILQVGINQFGHTFIDANTNNVHKDIIMQKYGGNLIVGGGTGPVKVGVQTSNPSSTFHINSTDGLIIPVGTAGERPDPAYQGMVRYNTTTSQFEGYGPGGNWGSLGGVINVAQNTKITVAEPDADSSNNEIKFYTAPTGDISANSATLRMIIDSSGNVGVGTAAPRCTLDISATDALLIPIGTSDERPTDLSDGMIRYNTTTSQFEGYGPGGNWGSLGGVVNVAQNTKITVAEPNADSSNNEIKFYTAPTGDISANSATLRMIVNDEGNVGIGTSTPQTTLDISGTITTNKARIGTGDLDDYSFSVQQKLLAGDGAANDYFGGSVAISGNYAIVGARYDDDKGSGSGSAYIFDVTTGTELHKLVPEDGAANDHFGYSVAISGNYAIVGAYNDDDKGTNSGSAYIFNVQTGVELHKLVPEYGAASDYFGWSVAMSGNYAIVGAKYDDDGSTDSGSAYIFNVQTGVELRKLVAIDAGTSDYFGYSVAIDGNYAIVGANSDDDNGTDSGSAYIFNVQTGTQLHKLVASDGAANDLFGFSVAISGNYAIVGGHYNDDNGSASGSAYIFNVQTGAQLQKLVPSDGVVNGYFGYSVTMSGNYAIVGTYGDTDNGTNSGSAYIFNVQTGALLHKHVPAYGAAGDSFGYSVAMSGNYAIVGAMMDDAKGTDSGSAYIFGPPQYDLRVLGGIDSTQLYVGQDKRLNDYSFSVQQKLLAGDGWTYDNFGYSVAISGNYAIVGAYADDDKGSSSGSAYIFNVQTGAELHKLVPEDGAANDNFGRSVAVSGNYAIVGANYDDDNGSNSGSAYIFNVQTGTQLHKLTASDGAASDEFGYSVAISGNYAIVGARNDDDKGTNSGSAYIFNVQTGVKLHKLVVIDGATSDKFGWSVAIDGNYAIVGAPYDSDKGTYSGSAYIFDVTTGTKLHKFVPADGAAHDQFGFSVAISGNYAIVGAHLDDDKGSISGSAYIFNVQTGVELRKLVASDGAASEYFGQSVAISGNYAIVGANYDDDNGENSGSAYIFNVQTGTQLQKLTASDGATNDNFGYSVAISGNYAIVGARYDDDNGSSSGSAYIFGPPISLSSHLLSIEDEGKIEVRGHLQIGEFETTYTYGNQLKLTADDDEAGDYFGHSVAISGNYAIVGSPYDDDHGNGSGSAYIFNVQTDTQLHKLVPGDSAADDYFGESVAISGNYAIVGARYDDDNGGNSGSAYIFNVQTGVELHKLTADDGAVNDYFGYSVAISGNYAIVGGYGNDDKGTSSGSAYIFNVQTGAQLHHLLAIDGAANDHFGISVAMSGNYAIVGAYADDDNGGNSGSAYIFDVQSVAPAQLQKLTASDGAAEDYFGHSVAISGNYAIVGAHYDDDNGSGSGSAYIFDVTTGTELHKLTASDGGVNDYFGKSVAISGNYAIVGARYDDDNGSNSGSAYIFNVQTGVELRKLVASDGAADDNFGFSVAISGNYAIVGAWGDDDNGLSSGSAYIYSHVLNQGEIHLDGRMGIGTLTPQYPLHIVGDQYIDGNLDVDGALHVENLQVNRNINNTMAMDFWDKTLQINLQDYSTEFGGLKDSVYANGYNYFIFERYDSGLLSYIVRIPKDNFSSNRVEWVRPFDTDTNLRGFSGITTDGTYIYACVYANGQGTNYNGHVLRIPTNNFNVSAMDYFDVNTVSGSNGNLKGHYGGCATDGKHLYLAPYSYGSPYSPYFVRIDLNDFSATGVEWMDVTTASGGHGSSKGFFGISIYRNYVYLIGGYNGGYHGNIVRVALNIANGSFSGASVQTTVLSSISSSYKGYNTGYGIGKYIYLVPTYNGGYHDNAIRISIENFSTSGVEVLNLGQTIGTAGGFTDGYYAYYSSYTGGNNASSRTIFRVPSDNWTIYGIEKLNLSTIIPNWTDIGLSRGHYDGTYGYLLGNYDGSYRGRIIRVPGSFVTNNTISTDRLFVKKNVGIGYPAGIGGNIHSKLHIHAVRDTRTTGGFANTPANFAWPIILNNISGAHRYNSGYGCGIKFKQYFAEVDDQRWSAIAGVSEDEYSDSTGLVFFTCNNYVVSEAMRINKNGYVGIGKTDPSYILDAVGQIRATGNLTTSDDRTKHNESIITNALSIISKLTPKHYIKTNELYDASHNFTLDASGNPLDTSGNPLELNEYYYIETGLIAQEIKMIPELRFAVKGEEFTEKTINIYLKDSSGNDVLDESGNRIIERTTIEQTPTTLGVDYNSILCTNITATKELYIMAQQQATTIQEQATTIQEQATTIQEQATTIQEQATTIQTLETQITDILTRLSNLENPSPSE